ncbi:MAG: S-methyl-5'-thioadenosine phosphorylase, partial [Dialister sp.]|nr:S-methyl-5'-thioadenosine phosphorylase [Dialister sp.]
MKKIAFIGGTGAENSVLLKDVTEHIIETPYGEAKYEAGFFEGREIIHLSRHGAHHTIPPHKINYRANMFALKILDVAAVISTTAVGSLNPDYKPGELVLLD